MTSLIVNPETDPHSYEPTAQDARTLAGAQMAIVNGIGYDNWAPKLLRRARWTGAWCSNVGERSALHAGDNPHQWYSPASVRRVMARIVAGYDRLDPRDAAYFAASRRSSNGAAWRATTRCASEIRAHYAGVAVGYSESIFQPLGEDLGLRLVTPYSFAKAVAEGTEVTAADKRAVDAQAQPAGYRGVGVQQPERDAGRAACERDRARRTRIPIATVTETLSPAGGQLSAVAGRGAAKASRGRSTRRPEMARPP